jgi:hypothetical protein
LRYPFADVVLLAERRISAYSFKGDVHVGKRSRIEITFDHGKPDELSTKRLYKGAVGRAESKGKPRDVFDVHNSRHGLVFHGSELNSPHRS